MSETPKTYWMSLVQRDSPSCGETDGDPDFVTTRRSFLKAAGFSFAGAMAASCGRGPMTTALPHIQQPEELVAGRPVVYASTCGACEARCGVFVTTRDGRPLKIEGNPDHPLSGGATCAVGQASILGLYDSQRLTAPLRRGQRAPWSEIDQEIRQALDRIRQEKGVVRILTPTITSPTTTALIASFVSTFSNARHVSYDALSHAAALDAHALTHGARLLPVCHFDRADVIVSFDADFLGTWRSPVHQARGFASRRRPQSGAPQPDGRPAMSYHVQIESRLSLTGSNADERLRVAPGELGSLASALAARLARRAGRSLPDGFGGEASALDGIADRLWAARGRALVVSGSQDVGVQALCNFMNEALGAYGTTLDLARPSFQHQGSDKELADLRAELARGEVQALIVAGANPVYDLSDSAGLANDLRRVGLIISTADRLDESSALAHFVCPDRHYLETWSDAEPISGLVSLTQPTIQPFGEARSFIESLSAWTAEEPKPALDAIRSHWESDIYPRAGPQDSFETFWNRTLERGVAEIAPRQVAVKAFDASALRPIPRQAQGSDTFALVLYPKIGMLDGRHAHNAWLHELPDPVTKVTWDNYASFSPAAAARLGLADGDVVRVTAEGASPLELPAFVQPGQDESTVAIAVGYGRAGTERFARVGPPWFLSRGREGVVGVNAWPLATLAGGLRQFAGRSVTVAKTGRTHALASTQAHHALEGSHTGIVQDLTLAELDAPVAAAPRGDEARPGLWPPDHEYRGHRWGMAVDLNACTGCSACVIACQAENNVPVVGQDEVLRRREMHWIRIDRYYSGSADAPRVDHEPMMCQHCEQAPCETVCPVLATTHSEEGLNEQVYNRCVGTRYCANNCPYKVRRFNWFDYPHEDRLQNLVFNPNVTVRSRGVMEKCTFCVQRIQETRIEARRLGQPLADGAVQTACQQVCPAQAIVFGDLNDPKSRVAELAASRRAYRVLEELNTKPAVTYLKAVRHG